MRADALENRQLILRAAWKLLSEKGLDVSFRAIAREAGVGVATMNRHFPDWESLLAGLSELIVEAVEEILEDHEKLWDQDAEFAWRQTIIDMVTSKAASLVGVFAAYFSAHPVSAELTDLVRKNMTFVRNIYGDLLTRAREHNLVPDSLDALQFHLGLVSIARPLPNVAEDIAPDHLKWMLNVYLDGLVYQAQR